ncbi:hypothetical protein DB811_16100 [Xanthomonas perforans]|nr:hypothetical protein DB811_16100 [Xanthomonas perforans]
MRPAHPASGRVDGAGRAFRWLARWAGSRRSSEDCALHAIVSRRLPVGDGQCDAPVQDRIDLDQRGRRDSGR